MKKSDATTLLKQLILIKENERYKEGKLLKIQFQQTYESLKPANILKSTFTEFISKSDIKAKTINTVIGVTSGLAAKKIVFGNTNSFFKKIMGSVLETAVATMVTKNADGIKLVVPQILKILIKQG